jgi:hypothetical protein
MIVDGCWREFLNEMVLLRNGELSTGKKDDLESYGLRMEAKQGMRFRVRPIERCSRGCWWTSITIDPRYMVGLGLKVSGSPNFEY